jgi:hypothetical protein
MQQTLDGSGSELADALKYVDEQMLTGMTDAQKAAVRPLLVRPLIQSFAVIVQPTEAEINKVWAAQVLQPFRQTLAMKYPFATESKAEASNAEIGVVFGPDGAIAKFFNTTLGPLVVRRGDTVSARTWANMGINLAPPVVASFPAGWRRWRPTASPMRRRPAAARADQLRPAGAGRGQRHRVHHRDRWPGPALARPAAALGAHGVAESCRCAGREDHRHYAGRPQRGDLQRAGPLRPEEDDRCGQAQTQGQWRVRADLG